MAFGIDLYDMRGAAAAANVVAAWKKRMPWPNVELMRLTSIHHKAAATYCTSPSVPLQYVLCGVSGKLFDWLVTS